MTPGVQHGEIPQARKDGRVIVSVASDSWVRGQDRLYAKAQQLGETCLFFRDTLPKGSPPHREYGRLRGPSHSCIPYAFKAYAMMEAAAKGYKRILWADACILPIRSLEPIWEHTAKYGAWIARNGWMNSEWCSDDWYKDAFPGVPLEEARDTNTFIPHVIATTFAVDLDRPMGRKLLEEYYRYASTTKAFCGPWQNTNAVQLAGVNADRPAAPCGPPSTYGHRHDQSCLSLIAWQLSIPLTEVPLFFKYADFREDGTFHVEDQDESTCLVANGRY